MVSIVTDFRLETDPGMRRLVLLPLCTPLETYCGAGGMSRGAEQAGLGVAWGLEKDPLAASAYVENPCGTYWSDLRSGTPCSTAAGAVGS